MPLKEPVEFLAIINKVEIKLTASNDKDVRIQMTVSDFDEVKSHVAKILADISAQEYFTVRISEGQ